MTRQPTLPPRGMTLVELVVVVAIIAILLTIAQASYREYVLRANRTYAMDALFDIAATQEKFLFANGRYAASLTAAPGADPATAGLGLRGDTRDESGDSAYYVLELETDARGLGYVARARPGGAQVDDRCGTFELDSDGGRRAAHGGCW